MRWGGIEEGSGMELFLQVVAGGTAIGLLYALPALAIVLLWNTAGFFNLAQGDFVALTSYFLYFFYIMMHMPFVLAAVLTILCLGAVGFIVDKALFHPLRRFNCNPLLMLIVTIALSVFLKNLIRAIWGTKPLSLGNVFGESPVNFFHAQIMPHTFWTVGLSLLLITGLYILSRKSLLGVAMRAAAESREVAQLMGVKSNFIISLSFIISLMITAVAGILATPILFLIPEMGDSLGLKAFAATIIGGFGNPLGAVVGGILLGIVETLAGIYLSSSYKDAIAFGILIAFLLFRPKGLFSLKISEKV
jgi:branched-chain amino acid transport system permease protein